MCVTFVSALVIGKVVGNVARPNKQTSSIPICLAPIVTFEMTVGSVSLDGEKFVKKSILMLAVDLSAEAPTCCVR